MARKASLTFVLFSALIVTSCSQESELGIEPPSLGDLGSKYLDYLNLVDEVDRFYCECSAQAGEFASTQECVAYHGGPTLPPLMSECYARTIDGFDQVREHVDCQVDKYKALLDCITAAGCGADLSACEQQASATTCPSRGYEVDAAVAEDCLGYSLPPAYECADGTKIMPWFECDFATDCPDGSDEYASCPGAFACQGGEVISQNWFCDGIADCSSGEDEANCPADPP